MYRGKDCPPTPRNLLMLMVIIVARISTEHQDRQSLADQIAKCKAYLKTIYDGKVQFKIIQSQGSGEHLDRKELAELEDDIESEQFDLVLSEDLARICRRRRAYEFCELCEDHETRLIAINDRVDTFDDGWQDIATMATWHHERSNRDTSDRIKRSLNNRFDLGLLIESSIYGYIRPKGAKNDSEVQKDPTAEPIIHKIFERIRDGASCLEVADWLNREKIPVGPSCRSSVWSSPMVSRLVRNKLLKGIRIRNVRVTGRKNSTGRHKSKKAPPEMLREREVPHLAYFEATYYDHVVSILNERTRKYRRGKDGSGDTRKGVPRKRTSWPGQHARCGVCGRLMYWTRLGTNTNAKALLCSGAQQYKCWNVLTILGERCQRAIAQAILSEIRRLPNFDAVFCQELNKQLNADIGNRAERKRAVDRELKANESDLNATVIALRKQPTSDTLHRALGDLEANKSRLEVEKKDLEREPKSIVKMPSHDELVHEVEEAFRCLLGMEPEIGRLLSALVPELFIVPYRACDNNAVEARAHLTIEMVSLLPDAARHSEAASSWSRELVVDLFELPQRVAIMTNVASLSSQSQKQRDIAKRLGVTQPAVQNSLRLIEKMKSLGISDPYQRLSDAPADIHKFKRLRHSRFNFEPLDGFPLPN